MKISCLAKDNFEGKTFVKKFGSRTKALKFFSFIKIQKFSVKFYNLKSSTVTSAPLDFILKQITKILSFPAVLCSPFSTLAFQLRFFTHHISILCWTQRNHLILFWLSSSMSCARGCSIDILPTRCDKFISWIHEKSRRFSFLSFSVAAVKNSFREFPERFHHTIS